MLKGIFIALDLLVVAGLLWLDRAGRTRIGPDWLFEITGNKFLSDCCVGKDGRLKSGAKWSLVVVLLLSALLAWFDIGVTPTAD